MVYLLKNKKKKNIRVISIEGEIKAQNSSLFNKQLGNQLDLLEKLYNIEMDDNIHGVLLRIDSPGGAAGTSEEIYQAVKAIANKKTVYASIGNMGCSGAYMIACAAHSIIANEMSIIGSIGVIMQIPNISKIKEKIGIDMITIKSGKMKDIGNMFRNMSEEERAYIQTLSDEYHQKFIDLVKTSRYRMLAGHNIDEILKNCNIDEVLDGRILSSEAAFKYGLIDDIGTYTDALRLLCQRIGTDLNKANIIRDKTKNNIINKIMSLSSQNIIESLFNNNVCLK